VLNFVDTFFMLLMLLMLLPLSQVDSPTLEEAVGCAQLR
jgi:hypothetical protein